jgi:prepilin-type N-terminal cleavage/methylation domain-containing protein
MYMLAARRGFTIVELLIVVVVIGILASISIVAYTGAQAQSRDTQRKADVTRIADALSLYATDNGNNFLEGGSGCASGGNGNGWFSYSGGTYPKSLSDCLKDAGYLKGGAQDPVTGPNGTSTPSAGYAYMKYTCTISGEKHTYIYAKLETGPNGSTNPINDAGVCNHTVIDTSYGEVK